MAATILMWLAVIGFIIANASFKKTKYDLAYHNEIMRKNLEKIRREQAEQQINHSRYGK